MSVSPKQSHVIVYSGERAAYYMNGGLVECGPDVWPSAILEQCRKASPCLFEERRTDAGVEFPEHLRDLPFMHSMASHTKRRLLDVS